MNELSSEGRALFDAAREADWPTGDDRRRLKSRLDARLALLVAAAPAGTAAASTASSAVTGLLLKVAAGAVLAAGGGFVAWRVLSVPHRPPPSPLPVAAPARPVEEAVEPSGTTGAEEPAEAAPVLTPPRVRSTPHLHHHAVRHEPVSSGFGGGGSLGPPVSAQDSLRVEVELLSQAQEAMRARQPARALELLDQHAEQFPHGKLRPERLAARVLALCALGHTAEARQQAQNFLSEEPSSPLVERVRGSCAFEPPP
jgi:hypothetical protein